MSKYFFTISFANKELANIQLAYGRHFVEIEIPSDNIIAILKPSGQHIESNTESLIQNALDVPFCRLDSSSKTGLRAEKTLLLLPDKTRNCGASLFLPLFLNYLNDIGIADDMLEILIANGSHVKNESSELLNILGEEASNRIQVNQHDAHNASELQFLGNTNFGIPVYLNKKVAAAKQVIIVGSAVHHYFAGFGGGPKMINPGCAGHETITRNHALTIDLEQGGMNRGCCAGRVAGNPIQEDIWDSMRFIPEPFLLETVLNHEGDVVSAFWGELRETHRHACAFVDGLYSVEIGELADLVVASCGGFPRDINFIQSHKTMENAFHAVKPGGVLLIFAECAQGIGSETFLEWFDYDDEMMVSRLARGYKLNGTTALSVKEKARSVDIILVSKLDRAIASKMGISVYRTVEQGWFQAKASLPDQYSGYIIPNGSLTLPVGRKNEVSN